MIASHEPQSARVAGFRTKLRVAIMLVVATVTLLALYFAQRSLTASVEQALEEEFRGELIAFERVRDVRRAVLLERCRALMRKPRISASLEDDALDLLYNNAEIELADIMAPPRAEPGASEHRPVPAQFYRFMDRKGALNPLPAPRSAGPATPEEEARLALPAVPTSPQVGYLERRAASGGATIAEIMAVPIFSTDTGEAIAALVLGFPPFEFGARDEQRQLKSGIWLEGALHAQALPASAHGVVAREIARGSSTPVRIELEGAPHLLFTKRLNPDSSYPAAFEVCAYPLSELATRQRRLTWQVLGAGAALLLVGLVGSQVVSSRLSAPVEKLAVDSAEDRAQRARAEAALEMTSAELQRSARFSADASHQLRTPVTVLRAGLEELLSRENLTPEECAEISALIHQTYRLSSLIEDLLLLSRLDAGRLKLEFSSVNLSHLIEASLDDLGAVPDERQLTVETDFPPDLVVVGEKRYTAMILQNLLENARKYNRPGGRIRIVATVDGDRVRLAIANTGRPIPPEARARIFERFHRGAMGENVPGYGLGLNLARELARLHQGELRLTRSDAEWTEFEASFLVARIAEAQSRSA